jgi:negative regulator of sigma E activity
MAEAAPPEPSEPFSEKPYDPLPERENIRGQIAQWLIWTLVGVVACVVLTAILTTVNCLQKDSCADQALDLSALRTVVELILTPLVGLVGAVTGFYFGEKSASTKPEPGSS